MSRTDPQLNVRLAPDRRAVLDAAAFVNKTTTLKIVEGLVEGAIDDYAKQPTVQKALEAQREQAAVDEGKLSHLRPASTPDSAPSEDRPA